MKKKEKLKRPINLSPLTPIRISPASLAGLIKESNQNISAKQDGGGGSYCIFQYTYAKSEGNRIVQCHVYWCKIHGVSYMAELCSGPELEFHPIIGQ